jgi:hypothetical protein
VAWLHQLTLYNPHSVPLQVKDVVSTDEFLQLHMPPPPGGSRDMTHDAGAALRFLPVDTGEHVTVAQVRLTKCWQNVVKMLAKCWQNVVKMLAKCWQNVGKMLAKCWQNVGKMLSKCCQNVVKMLAKCCQNVGKMLAKCCSSTPTPWCVSWRQTRVRTPTRAPAASLRRHSCDLIARRRSSCVGPPHSHTHAASTDGICMVVG